MFVEALIEYGGIITFFFVAPWFVLALLSAFGDALVGFVDEWLLKRVAADQPVEIDAPGRLVLISGSFGIITSILVVLFSMATTSYGGITFQFESLRLAIYAGVLEVLWLIPYFYALKRGGAVNVTPLFQTIPIFSLIFGVAFFSEIPTLINCLAGLIILSGAVLLNYSSTKHKVQGKTIWLMFISAAIISFGYFLFKDAAESANFLTALFGNGVGMFLTSAFIWIIWKPYRLEFNAFVKTGDVKIAAMQFANEGLYTVATIANQLALVLGPSVLAVSVMNSFHPVFTLLIGVILAKLGSTAHTGLLEKSTLYKKLLAIFLIAIGAAIIVF